MNKGVLHLIPNVLYEGEIHVIPEYIKVLLSQIKIFYVEEIKSARRLLKKLNRETDIDTLTFHIINEHSIEALNKIEYYTNEGKDIAYISEAGCPAVADPGNVLVQKAHENNIRVIPHVGPNSIILALMASGMNGQHFCFHGYLPIKQPMLNKKILELESNSTAWQRSEIFIEAPYRNHQMLALLLDILKPATRLCVAIGITSPQEKILSMPIQEWKKQHIQFHKIPAIFIIDTTPV